MRPRLRNGTRYLGMSPRGGIAGPHEAYYSETNVGCQRADGFCRAWNFDRPDLYHCGAPNRQLAKDQPMHSHSVEQWTHDHLFLGEKHAHNERRTWWVVALTAVMMVGEIAAGSIFGS